MSQGLGMLTVMGGVLSLVAPFVGLLVGGYAVVALVKAVRRGSGV